MLHNSTTINRENMKLFTHNITSIQRESSEQSTHPSPCRIQPVRRHEWLLRRVTSAAVVANEGNIQKEPIASPQCIKLIVWAPLGQKVFFPLNLAPSVTTAPHSLQLLFKILRWGLQWRLKRLLLSLCPDGIAFIPGLPSPATPTPFLGNP